MVVLTTPQEVDQETQKHEIHDQALSMDLASSVIIAWSTSTFSSTYPYTVDIEYELEHNTYLWFLLFNICRERRCQCNIQRIRFNFLRSWRRAIRPCYGCKPSKGKTVMAGVDHLDFWKCKPEKLDRWSAGLFPKILAAPTQFEFDGYVAICRVGRNMVSGACCWTMEGRNFRRNEEKNKDLTNGIGTIEQKWKFLRIFTEQNTLCRIQEGMGVCSHFLPSRWWNGVRRLQGTSTIWLHY